MHPAAALPGLGRGRLLLFLASPLTLAAAAFAYVAPAPVFAAPTDPAPATCGAANPASVTYTVKSGDTLYGIAANLGVGDEDGWIAKVVSLNSLNDPDSVREGLALSLPPNAPPDPAKGATPYTIKNGDTLSAIADNLGIDSASAPCWMAQVVSLNKLAGVDSLTAGQSISLPPAPGATSAVASPASSSTGPGSGAALAAPQKNGLVYTIATGDTLYGIAVKLGVPSSQQDAWVAAAVSLSQLPDADHLTAGQTLTVPALASSAPVSTPVVTVATPSPAVAAAPAPTPAASVSSGPVPMTATASAASAASVANSAPTTNASIAAANTPVTASVSSSPVYLQGGSFYTLKTGDTLKAIAQKLGVPADKQDFWIAEVAAINGISPTALPIGDGIKIP